MYVNEGTKFAVCYFGEGTSLILTGRRCPQFPRKYRLLIFPRTRNNKILFSRGMRAFQRAGQRCIL